MELLFNLLKEPFNLYPDLHTVRSFQVGVQVLDVLLKLRIEDRIHQGLGVLQVLGVVTAGQSRLELLLEQSLPQLLEELLHS